jgi:uncharacterized membrane protein YecN with MAPEG domain
MTKNVGSIDKIARVIVGLLMIVLALVGSIGWWGWIIGAVLLATGLMSSCPAYSLLGVNTCSAETKSQ